LNNKNQIINNLQNELNNLNIVNNKNQSLIQNLKNDISNKEQELLSLKNELNIKKEELNIIKKELNIKKEELNKIKSNNMVDKGQIFSINFMSVSHDKIFPISCSSNDTVVKFEELFYNEYPEYKDHNTYLTVNGNPVKRFKTIEENGIKQGNAIIVDVYDG
jgi:DNA-directed RNA polymerase subunit H (RpoH/RPB5)